MIKSQFAIIRQITTTNKPSSFVEEYARQLRRKHDPLESLLKAPHQPPAHRSDRVKARRSRNNSDQIITNALLANNSTKSRVKVSSRMWTRSEDEVLVKSVLESISGSSNEIENLDSFLNSADGKIVKSVKDVEVERRLPNECGLDEVDWVRVSNDLPFRVPDMCRDRFIELVQPRKRQEYDNVNKHYVDAWRDDEIQRLRLGVIRYGHPMGMCGQSIVDWEKLSLFVGKSQLQCRRKLHYLTQLKNTLNGSLFN